MFENVIADWGRYQGRATNSGTGFNAQMLKKALLTQGCWASAEYRYRRWAWALPPPYRRPFMVIGGWFTSKIIQILTGISIDTLADIGSGLYIGHFGGIVIGGDVKMGRDCKIFHGVTIGQALYGQTERGSPSIGDRVLLATGAKVFGPITIGSDARIGANAVVFVDVPAGATAVGVPARVIQRQDWRE